MVKTAIEPMRNRADELDAMVQLRQTAQYVTRIANAAETLYRANLIGPAELATIARRVKVSVE